MTLQLRASISREPNASRWAGIFLTVFMLIAFSDQSAPAQSVTSSPTQMQTTQQQAHAALMSQVQPISIALDGTFSSTAGSLQQNGTAHLIVGSDGSFSTSLSASTGTKTESRAVTGGIPACSWTDPKGATHQISFLNCMSPAWFFPGLALLSPNSDPSLPGWSPNSYATDAMGNHLQFQFLLPINGTQEDSQLLKPFDLILAPDTYLPQYAKFTAHPDNPGMNADIPVLISYADYRNISGVMIPFHIRRFVSGSLILDLEISSASIQ